MSMKELVAALILGAFLLIILIGHAGIREGADMIGDAGVINTILAGLTLLGVGAAAFSAWSSHMTSQRTLALTVESELNNRFLTASQMLASDKRGQESASIMIMAELALSEDRFLQPVLATISGHIIDQNRELYEKLYAAIDAKAVHQSITLPSSTKATLWAFNCLGLIWARRLGPTEKLPSHAKTTLTDMLLYNGVIKQRNYGLMQIAVGIVGRMSFINCGFVDADIKILAIGPVELVGCRLDGAKIEITDCRKTISGISPTGPFVRLVSNVGTPAHVMVDGVPASRSGLVQWH